MARMGGGPGNRYGKKSEKAKDAKGTLKKLLRYISSFKWLLLAIIVLVIIYTLLTLAANVFLKDVVASLGTYDADNNAFTVIPDQNVFVNSIVMLIVCYAGYIIFNFAASYLSTVFSNKVVKKLRADLFDKIVYLPIKYTDTNSHGDIMSRITNDVDNISNALSSSVISLISSIITIIGCLGIMLWYSPLLTAVSMISLILSMGLALFMATFMRPLFSKQQKVLGELNTETEETVTSFLTVKAYNHQPEAIKAFNEKSDELKKAGLKANIIGGSMGPVMNFIGNLTYFLVCIFGSIFILNNVGGTLLGQSLTIAIVVMFLTTSKQFNRPIAEVAQLYSGIVSALAGAERIFKVLDENKEDFSKKEDFDINDFQGHIDFRGVDFSYVEGNQVLNDFNLSIEPGEKIALVGATGSGKTTIVNLLLKFYDIDRGSITIDGKNIDDISKKDLRSAISIVLQDPMLFADTIANNVKYGKEDATDEEIDYALDFANCKFVRKMADGKNTELFEGASNISQGQRQLLTIARAVLADPKILILDEATSSVDTRTEKKIQDAMVKLMENRTSIIIAHRLSTIQDADKIVVMDHGHVVEIGNHKSLLEKNGVYASLYNTQFKGLNT